MAERKNRYDITRKLFERDSVNFLTEKSSLGIQPDPEEFLGMLGPEKAITQLCNLVRINFSDFIDSFDWFDKGNNIYIFSNRTNLVENISLLAENRDIIKYFEGKGFGHDISEIGAYKLHFFTLPRKEENHKALSSGNVLGEYNNLTNRLYSGLDFPEDV